MRYGGGTRAFAAGVYGSLIMKTHTFAMRACALEYGLDGSAQHPGAHTMLLMVYTEYLLCGVVVVVVVVDDNMVCDAVGEVL